MVASKVKILKKQVVAKLQAVFNSPTFNPRKTLE